MDKKVRSLSLSFHLTPHLKTYYSYTVCVPCVLVMVSPFQKDKKGLKLYICLLSMSLGIKDLELCIISILKLT